MSRRGAPVSIKAEEGQPLEPEQEQVELVGPGDRQDRTGQAIDPAGVPGQAPEPLVGPKRGKARDDDHQDTHAGGRGSEDRDAPGGAAGEGDPGQSDKERRGTVGGRQPGLPPDVWPVPCSLLVPTGTSVERDMAFDCTTVAEPTWESRTQAPAMIGKVDPESLAALVLSRTGAGDQTVQQGPDYGEDAAAIDLGDRTLVVSSDPLSLAAKRLGTLGVHVAGNDVAASGADPRWLTSVLFLPAEDPDVLDVVTGQLDRAAAETGVTIVGGHTEYAPALERPRLALTCFGLTDRFVPTGGAEPGDRLLLTKGAGIEATAILATDFRDRLAGVVDPEVLESAAGYFDEISIVPDARAVRDVATAMHDPTEGGLIDGLLELACAAGVRAVVHREDIPVRDATDTCCKAVDVEPLAVFGSGALIASVPKAAVDDALDALAAAGIDAAIIGRVEASETPALVLDDEPITDPVRDELYSLWA